MLVIPTQPIPAQTISVVLANQSCRITLYQKSTGLFVDLYVNDVLIIGGVICHNAVIIVRDAYLGFTGDLILFDLQGLDDPSYTGLGTRWILMYVEASDIL